MLILEGPDGAGKSQLATTLARSIDWPIAPRVVSKETKAMVNLKSWTEENLEAGFVPRIFDRHRLLSDPIYRFIISGKKMDWELYDLDWLSYAMNRFWQLEPLVIYCLPPLAEVQGNLAHDPDNVVVHDDIDRIYGAYIAQASVNRHREGVFIYDYTVDSILDIQLQVLRYLRQQGRF